MKKAWRKLLWMGWDGQGSNHEAKAFQSLRKSLTRFSGAAETQKTPAGERSGDIGIKFLQFITHVEYQTPLPTPTEYLTLSALPL